MGDLGVRETPRKHGGDPNARWPNHDLMYEVYQTSLYKRL